MFRFAAILLVLAALTYHPAPTEAAASCVRLIPDRGGETIINACDACRVVNIRRKRQGIAVPVTRSYNVQPKSTFPVSFKGPGRSRITSVVPCEGEAGSHANLVNPKDREVARKQCVNLKEISGGGVALVNSCGECRAAAIERYNPQGRSLGREAFKINGQSVHTVPQRGAARVGYLADIPCNS